MIDYEQIREDYKIPPDLFLVDQFVNPREIVFVSTFRGGNYSIVINLDTSTAVKRTETIQIAEVLWPEE